MLNLDKYNSLGAALREALDRWPNETCLIESDRDKEKTRLTYSDFKEMALPLARALEDAEFSPGDRAAIIMSNQSKWLISAYAIFHGGGVLVPLDYKLTAAEHLQLLAHSKAKVLVIEYYLWRAIIQSPEFKEYNVQTVLVTEAPPGADLRPPFAGRTFAARVSRYLCPARGRTWPASSIRRGPADVPRGACLPMKIIWSSARR